MNELDLKKNLSLSNPEFRSRVVELENRINSLDKEHKIEPADCPLKHLFSDGMYVREVTVPQGTVVIGKIHKHNHVWFLLTGMISVADENDTVDHIAPCYVEAPAGSKRMIYAHEDSVWVNVHANPTNTQDLKELEDLIIAKDYEEFNNKK